VIWGITFSFELNDHDGSEQCGWESGEPIKSDPDGKVGLVRIAHDCASLRRVGVFLGVPVHVDSLRGRNLKQGQEKGWRLSLRFGVQSPFAHWSELVGGGGRRLRGCGSILVA